MQKPTYAKANSTNKKYIICYNITKHIDMSMQPFNIPWHEFQPELFLLACICIVAYLVFPREIKQAANTLIGKGVLLIVLMEMTRRNLIFGLLIAAFYIWVQQTKEGFGSFGGDKKESKKGKNKKGEKKKNEDDEEDEKDEDEEKDDEEKDNEEDEEDDEEEDDKAEPQVQVALMAYQEKKKSDMNYSRFCKDNKLIPGIEFPKEIKYTGCKDPCNKKCKFKGQEKKSSGGGMGF